MITAMVDGFHGDPRRMTVLFFQHCGGASGRVAENATAFAHRYAMANMMTVAAWPVGATRTRRRTSRRRAATGRRSSRSRAGSTSTTWRAKSRRRSINENYRGNYQRLVALKIEVRPDEPVPAERERHADEG